MKGIYRIFAKHSGHGLQRMQVNNGMDLTELALEGQIHWAACWVGTGCQIRGAGWAAIVHKWCTGGASWLIDQPHHQQTSQGSKRRRWHICKNNMHFTPSWHITLICSLPYRLMQPSYLMRQTTLLVICSQYFWKGCICFISAYFHFFFSTQV